MTDKFGLHRNVHPNHMYDGDVTMEAFSPSSKENYELSVDCEKVWLGRNSFNYRTSVLGRGSVGVWTIPRDLFSSLKFSVNAAPEDGNASHSLVIFPKNDKAKRRDAARRLAAVANAGPISKI